jgi:ubiquitin carboxyl-terminal hydrolase 5/13
MMGFPEKKCKKALRECQNDPERAMDWIFSHPDDDGQEEDSQMEAANAGPDPTEIEN